MRSVDSYTKWGQDFNRSLLVTVLIFIDLFSLLYVHKDSYGKLHVNAHLGEGIEFRGRAPLGSYTEENKCGSLLLSYIGKLF